MKLVPVLAVAVLAGTTLVGATATAQTTPQRGGTVHVIDYGDGEGVGGTIVLTGAIGDSGSAGDIDANGTPDAANNTKVELSLVRGDFAVNVVALNKGIGAAFNNKFSPNSNTCSGYVTVTAVSPIVAGSGTGQYAGISGSFHLALTFALISPQYKTGAHKGQCNFSSMYPIAQAVITEGTGTVSFS
jgi:hypothetical protein